MLIFSIFNCQCLVGELTLELLGKNKYDAKNILFTNKNVSEVKEDPFVLNEDLGYLPEKHKKSFMTFNKSSDYKCFPNSNSSSRYILKLIDDKVYQIYVTTEYPLQDFLTFENNYDNVELAIYDDYPNIDSGYHLFGKFLNEEQKVGESTHFSKNKIGKDEKIWKVNQVMLSKKNVYEFDFKNSVNKNNQTGFQIELQFTDLRNTVLDNRGY